MPELFVRRLEILNRCLTAVEEWLPKLTQERLLDEVRTKVAEFTALHNQFHENQQEQMQRSEWAESTIEKAIKSASKLDKFDSQLSNLFSDKLKGFESYIAEQRADLQKMIDFSKAGITSTNSVDVSVLDDKVKELRRITTSLESQVGNVARALVLQQTAEVGQEASPAGFRVMVQQPMQAPKGLPLYQLENKNRLPREGSLGSSRAESRSSSVDSSVSQRAATIKYFGPEAFSHMTCKHHLMGRCAFGEDCDFTHLQNCSVAVKKRGRG